MDKQRIIEGDGMTEKAAAAPEPVAWTKCECGRFGACHEECNFMSEPVVDEGYPGIAHDFETAKQRVALLEGLLAEAPTYVRESGDALTVAAEKYLERIRAALNGG